MALRDIRERITVILASVEGVGVVHQYRRFAASQDKFLELFRRENKDGQNEINGWMITRTSTPAERGPMPVVHRKHVFMIYGMYGLKDAAASELVFQDLVEAIQDKFDPQFTLENLAVNSGPMQVMVVEPRMFGSVLCHVAELRYEVVERVTYSV